MLLPWYLALSAFASVWRTSKTDSRLPLATAKMKHMAAYLLLGLGGNTSPSAEDIKGVLSSVGIEADDERLNTLLKELEGKDISEVCAGPKAPFHHE